MTLLPFFQTSIRELSQLQTQWRSILNTFISNPALQSVILTSVPLKSGSNTISHTLGRKLQGWKLVRQRAAGTVYDQQDSNAYPDLTLVLVASAPMVVDLELF